MVLGWINAKPLSAKTFVANRVTQIHEVLAPDVWQHVSGVDNPADCASRGLDPSELKDHPLWWTGPNWLLDEQPPTHVTPDMTPGERVLFELELKPTVAQVLHVKCANDVSDSLLLRYSYLSRLKRITGWCLRFANNCRAAAQKKPFTSVRGQLSAAELDAALLKWIKVVQRSKFAVEIQDVGSGRFSANNKLKSLNPILDSQQILRVGGRLRHAELDYGQRHPIILPKKHRLTELIIQAEHRVQLHGGAQLVQSALQRRYWIVRARDVIRMLVRKCVICARHRHATAQQMMADLPAVRVTPAPAFVNTGVDYAGPFLTRAMNKRSKLPPIKAYMALFICMVTRAIHLEVVSSMSTEEFLAALRRFIARRGKPAQIYSDCGTNFVGANNELSELMTLFNSEVHQNKVGRHLAEQGIE